MTIKERLKKVAGGVIWIITAPFIKVFSLFDKNDIIIVLGVSLLGYGLYLIFPPAAYIVSGGVFLFIALR